MTLRRSTFAAIAAATTFTGFLLFQQQTVAAGTRSFSHVFDPAASWDVMAVLPDTSAFLKKLRSGDSMRAFFDSPLGLHFLRSAPFRSTAHLHRLISLAPRSWQWNLYSLITDGPVFYRSQGSSFTLVIALNRKGRVVTTLLSEAHAGRVDDWLVIASDKSTLESQVAYLKSPKPRPMRQDAQLDRTSALSVNWNAPAEKLAQRSLTRALLKNSLGLIPGAGCSVSLQPEVDAISIQGECDRTTAASGQHSETLSLANFPAWVSHRTGNDPMHLLALGGFAAEFGNLIPRLFFTGPVTDSKSLEFLSQAFKTRRHILQTKDGTMQILYPYPYTYSDRKYDTFSPYLSTDDQRFYWYSYLDQAGTAPEKATLGPGESFRLQVNLYPLIRNSEAALRQFDAIYSPGHFNEFRDALAKSTPALRNASVRFFAKPENRQLRLGGVIAFAENP